MKRSAILTIGFFISLQYLTAQGCSDAGFCTIGEMKHESSDTTVNYLTKLTLGPTIGVGEDNTLIVTPYFQYDRQLANRFSVQGKLTGNYASGRLATIAGLGDVFLSASYTTKKKKNAVWSFTLGGKIPLSTGNIKENGAALPFTYQSSLGTTDLIGGIRWKLRKVSVTGGAQIPLFTTDKDDRSRGENEFLQTDPEFASEYPSTNEFNRRADLLLKIGYEFSLGKKILIIPGFLGVYHLGNDHYSTSSETNDLVAIPHSSGLTLNLIVFASYKISSQWKCGINVGTPLVVREIRPDGLTRRFVFGPEISYQF